MCAGYRGISIALANHRKDYHAADCALKAAEAFKVSEMMHQRLQKDRKALNSFLATAAAATRSYDFSKAATQRAASPSKSKVNSGNVGCLVFLVIAGLFQFFASSIGKWRTSQPSSIKSTEAASSLSQSTPRRLAAPTPESYSAARREPIVTSNPIDAPDLPRGDSSQLSVDSILPDIGGNTRTYRLPSHYMAELRADQKTIDSEKTKVTAFGIRLSQAEKKVETEKAKFDRVQNRLMQINTHIQEERAYLDKRNPSAVAEWNRMLRNYNDLSVEVNALNFGANQAVQAYNTILAGMRRQNEIFNSMVNKYNAKLAQYGRLVASE